MTIQNMYFVDTFNESLFKKGEELCGDMVSVIRRPMATTLVLADGMGSGVRANMLATLTSRIISTMISGNAAIEDCVETISKTLPVLSERDVAYSTFTIVQVEHTGEVYIAEFDGPEVVILRDGVLDEPDKTEKIIEGKTVLECRFDAEPGDMIIAFSDGVINAGDGEILNYGWERVNVMEYIQRTYKDGMSAREMTRNLMNVCNGLYKEEPGDDVTVACIRLMERTSTRVMVGPASSPEKDENEVNRLIRASGNKIVCGGTTSKIVARIMGNELSVKQGSFDAEVPPIGYIQGIDLVTEGLITLSAAEKLLDRYLSEYNASLRPDKCVDLSENDGASMLVRMLVDESSDIIFMIGEANNPAYKSGDLGLDLDMKIRLVYSIIEKLQKLGKNISVERY